MSQLTEEQRKRIEENRRKALEKRAGKLPPNGCETKSTSLISLLNYQVTSNATDGKVSVNGVIGCDTSYVYKPMKFDARGAKQKTEQRHEQNLKLPTSSNSSINHQSHKNVNDKTVNGTNEVKGTCVLLSRKRFYVDVGYHKLLIDIFRTIPSRMYDAQTKKWNFLLEDHDKLISLVKPLQPEVIVASLPLTLVNKFLKSSETVEIKDYDLSSLDPVLLNALLPFQKEGVKFCIQHGGKALIADDMGLGKTIQAIAVADYYKNDWPLLVVTPSSMKYSWVEAFQLWLPSLDPTEITVINTSKDHIPNNKVVLMSYDMLSKKKDDIIKRRFKFAIMDESHLLKNQKSARTKAAQIIMKHLNRILMLSGTPALSRPVELFTQLSALRPKDFPSYVAYGVRYCNGKMGSWGWDFSGSSNMEELRLFLEETVMIRRLKSDVMKQLPSKFRQMIILDPSKVLTKSKVLKSMSLRMAQKNLSGMERRGVLLQYFHETGITKLPAICEYVMDLLESDHKFLCFAHHRVVMDGICEAIENTKTNYIRIDGSTMAEERKRLVDKFQVNDSYKVAVLSITAASTGITLTAASLVIFAELFWNPGILTQAEDRAHRIGQENSVTIQYLVGKKTADDEMWPLVQRKLDILNKAGLSKDNFKTADTINVEDSKQPHLEDFWNEIANAIDLSETDCEFPNKRSKVE